MGYSPPQSTGTYHVSSIHCSDRNFAGYNLKAASEYFEHMVNYRVQLQELFPEYKCHPNHHMALHLDEFLEMCGPVHGWWAFPFERMIGTLQRISTNYKPRM